jgi:hypothetical protein
MAIIIARGDKMVNIANRPRYFLDIDPRLRNRVKAVAAISSKTMKEWLTEAIIEKLENDIDILDSLEAIKDKDGSISLRDYLKLHQET